MVILMLSLIACSKEKDKYIGFWQEKNFKKSHFHEYPKTLHVFKSGASYFSDYTGASSIYWDSDNKIFKNKNISLIYSEDLKQITILEGSKVVDTYTKISQ